MALSILCKGARSKKSSPGMLHLLLRLPLSKKRHLRVLHEVGLGYGIGTHKKN